jgi:hypothetical protein
VGILLATLIVLGAARFFFKKFNKNIDYDNWQEVSVFGLTLSLCVILLRNTFSALGLSPLVIIAVLVPVIIVARSKIKPSLLQKISFVFLALMVVAMSSLIIDISKQKDPIEDWTTKNKKINDQIKFVKKPNVYLIITESYPNKEALERIYNFDNSAFYEKLENFNFTLHHRYYSNYNHTFSSLPSLFGMEHHYYSINFRNFDSVGGRKMLEAKTYNPVVDIFRQNKYKIQFIQNIDGLLPRGAAVDYCSPSSPVYLALETFLTHQDTTKKSIIAARKLNFFNILTERFSNNLTTANPTFSFIYFNQPHHSPSKMSQKNKIENTKILEAFRAEYYKKVEEANVHLIKIIELILKNDLDPVIVIAGDHGPWGYRVKTDGYGRTVPDNLFALDRFGVLMAIRFPTDYQGEFDKEFKTHVNIFRYIFAYMNNSNRILETKAKDDSFDSGSDMAILDGRILPKYLPVVFPKALWDEKKP